MIDRVDPAPRVAESATRFDELFRRLYPPAYGVVYRVLGDRAESEDTLQEAFVRLTGSPVLSRPDEEVAAWLRRVSLNLAFNRARGERRARERVERFGRLEGDSQAPPAVQTVLLDETRREVRHALMALPERQRACLVLRHSGYSYAEIAATLEIAIGSVGVLLARAERAFRETYKERTDDLS